MNLTKVEIIEKGSIYAYVEVAMPKMGITIRRVPIIKKDKAMWANLPSFSVENNGEREWYSYVQFLDESHGKAWAKQVKGLFDEWLVQNG